MFQTCRPPHRLTYLLLCLGAAGAACNSSSGAEMPGSDSSTDVASEGTPSSSGSFGGGGSDSASSGSSSGSMSESPACDAASAADAARCDASLGDAGSDATTAGACGQCFHSKCAAELNFCATDCVCAVPFACVTASGVFSDYSRCPDAINALSNGNCAFMALAGCIARNCHAECIAQDAGGGGG